MSNVKISELPVATTVDDTDVIPVVQGGVTKKVAKSILLSVVNAAIALKQNTADAFSGDYNDLTNKREIVRSATAPVSPADGDLWLDTSTALDPEVVSQDITSIVSLTQLEYDALTPVATTLYVITT